MMNQSVQNYSELASKLERLLATQPKVREDIDPWYANARQVEDELTAPGGLGSIVPEFLWHFLADADIRLKDSAYANQQNELLRRLIAHLVRGVMPSGNDLTRAVD